jgi:hypothetical protein
MSSATLIHPRRNLLVAIAALAVGAAITWTFFQSGWGAGDAPETRAFLPRKYTDTSGFALIVNGVKRWPPTASLAEIADCWRNAAQEQVAAADETLASLPEFDRVLIPAYLHKASALNYQSQPRQAYAVLQELRRRLEPHPHFAEEWLYSVVYFQGITALRIGEDDNCILCRGESSCILPISSAAVHTQPEGSRLAIRHFTEYLQQFPDDRDVRWLLNLAHLTLGEHPGNVDPRFLVPLDRFAKSELDIGKFRDIGHVVGVNRFNQGGGGIMDDFDNDGLLDIVVSSIDPLQPMGLYRNRGDGTFEDRTDAAGLSNQLGGLYCVQADYDNDGWLDLFVPRGAWLDTPMRPSLLRNNGDGKFKDVTQAAGILHPANSISAAWVDYDNDGFLDLFVCSDIGANLLFRNQGDGTFEEVAARAGLQGSGMNCKGSAWLDFDRDDWTDVFLNYRNGPPQLFRNRGDGTFQDVTESMGIRGPLLGFSCWAFDYDNDGWLDIFATSYDRTLGDAIEGLLGNPHSCHGSVLYRNKEGKRFENVTKRVGLDMVFVTMGSNYGDFDNDGFLDFYLGTGDPNLGMLVPNRMLKNVAGRRFAEITGSSGTGHLQKGHGVAAGDWDRNGSVDIFIQMGGASDGDKYHNILFQNPGQGNNWLTLKLIGTKTNRSAIGARIKVVTDEKEPLTIYRHVSTGSSFGANPLQQTIGLGKAANIAQVEIHWPASGTTQVFREVAPNQAIEVTEFAKDYRLLEWQPVPLPAEK